jgi:hypothetical protein
MYRFRTAAAVIGLLSIVSCASDQPTDSYEMSRLAAASAPAPMDASRRIAKQDCTRSVVTDRGNLLCE